MQYCAQAGCPNLVPRGRCPVHAQRPNVDVRRLYRTAPWRRLRDQVLRESNYTCAQCGHVQVDLEVDHIVRHDGNVTLFWSRANLQPLCKPCHTRKTAGGA
jgi:5-methylcytosine-specific restriction protein A